MSEQARHSDEINLMQRAAAGEAAAFQAIFTRYQDRIYNYVCRMVGDPIEAQDLTQDSFIKAYQALQRGDSPANPTAWLYCIASRTCLDALRRRRLIRWLPLAKLREQRRPTARDADSPEQHLLRAQERDRIRQALERLPPRYRMVLLLREYEGLSYKQIAEVTGDSLSTVKVTLYRARERCRHEYQTLEGWDDGMS
jgi:RNA polymerase sigma-70 factor (ECF subfamily)